MKTLRIQLGAIVLAVLCCGSSARSAGWQALPDLPEPNGGFIAGVVGGELVIMGGTNWRNDTKHWLDRIWVYRSRQRCWHPAGNLPSAMAYAAAGSSADGTFLVGGSNGVQTHQQIYRLDNQLQLRSLAHITQRVVYGGAAMVGANLHVLGGAADASDLKTLSSAFFAIDPASGRTKQLPAFPGGKVTSPVLVAMGDRVCVFTGAFLDPASGTIMNVASAYAYSIPRARWSRLKAYPFAVRGLAGVALDDRHIFLGGGYKSDREGFTDEAFLYDVRTDAYLQTTPLPYRAMATLVKSGDKLWCLGGEDQKRHRTDQFYEMDWKRLMEQAAGTVR